MNDDLEFTRLRELVWRRPLSADEQAQLRARLEANPEARADWDAEARMSELLARLPDARVPSNFVSRVLQAVDLEEARRTRARAETRRWWWHSLVPRAAIALALATTLSSAYHHRLLARRLELAESVAAVAEARSLPNPTVLTKQNFDVIRRLDQAPQVEAPDTALLALMQ